MTSVGLKRTLVLCLSVVIGLTVSVAQAAPVPVGSSTTAVSFTTASGVQTHTASIDYRGQFITDAIPLAGAQNIWSFNSANSFGRRSLLDMRGVPVLDAANESLISNAFFKGDNGDDYFPGILPDSDITVQVSGVTFNSPVSVIDSTVMLHVLWRSDQADALSPPLFNRHNHHIPSTDFRELQEFIDAREFLELPAPNYVVGDTNVTVTIRNTAPNVIDIEATFPYTILRHSEDVGQDIPEGLPAPHGFLEPFHFHLEYVVTPEPTTLLLLAAGATMLRRRRKC